MAEHVIDIQVAGMMGVDRVRCNLPNCIFDRLDNVEQVETVEPIVG